MDVLQSLDTILNPEKPQIINLYSRVMLDIIDRTVSGRVTDEVVKDLHGRCKYSGMGLGEFRRFLEDENRWMCMFLYIALKQTTEHLVNVGDFNKLFVANILNPIRGNRRMVYLPVLSPGFIFREISRVNHDFTKVTDMGVDTNRKETWLTKSRGYIAFSYLVSLFSPRKNAHICLQRKTTTDWRSELQTYFGDEEVVTSLLRDDCEFTKNMLWAAPKVATGVDVTLDELICETSYDGPCKYKILYETESGLRVIRKFFDMPRQLAMFHAAQMESNQVIAAQTETIRRQRDHTMHLLERTAPPAQIPRMLRSPDGRLVGERVRATILFSDICGYTAFADDMNPEIVNTLLNSYFDIMGELISIWDGYQVKTIGDGLMASFGADRETPAHPVNGVLCGLRMLDAVQETELARVMAGKGANPASLVRIGLNTGDVIRGTLGSEDNYGWDLTGSAVNLASRMESSGVSGRVTISQGTYNLIAPFFNVEKAQVTPKHFSEPVKVYHLVGLKFVHECKERTNGDESYFAELENELIKYEQRVLPDYDFVLYSARKGDPLRTRTVAMLSLAISNGLACSDVDMDKVKRLSYLHQIGERDVRTNPNLPVYSSENDPDRPKKIQFSTLKILRQEISDNALVSLVEDLFKESARIESQIVKAAIIYADLRCPKFGMPDYKDVSVRNQLEQQGIPCKIVDVMGRLGLNL